jgi:hypothetical protein
MELMEGGLAVCLPVRFVSVPPQNLALLPLIFCALALRLRTETSCAAELKCLRIETRTMTGMRGGVSEVKQRWYCVQSLEP